MRKSEYIKLDGKIVIGYSETEEEKEFWELLKEENIVNITYLEGEIQSITVSVKQKLQKIKETLVVLEALIYDGESNFSSIRAKEMLSSCGCKIVEIKSGGLENQYILLDENKAKMVYEDMDFLNYFNNSEKEILQTIEQQNVQTIFAENNNGNIHAEQHINNMNEIVQYIFDHLQVLKECQVDQSRVNEFLKTKDTGKLRGVMESICLVLGAGESLTTLGPILLTILNFLLPR